MDKAALVEELRKIGLQEGMDIEVHSSLSSFGYVEGGAETVIEALMELDKAILKYILCVELKFFFYFFINIRTSITKVLQ